MKKITPVMIAKDILKWLQPGSPVKIRPIEHNGYVKAKKPGDLRAYLKAGKPCEVCGIGALACAVAYRIDALEIADYSSIYTNSGLLKGFDYDDFDTAGVSRESIVDYLAPYFSTDNLAIIEDAFESGSFIEKPGKSAKKRLKQICENIIANKGTFVPRGGILNG